MRFFKKADRAAIADEKAMKKRKKRAAKAARRMTRDRFLSDDEPITMTIRETHEQLYIEPDNAQTIGMREEQQDAFIFSNVYSDDDNADIGCVAVLADGMGGLADGYTAASTGVEEFLNVYSSEVKDGELTLAAMEDAVYSANRAVCRIGNSGATLIGAVGTYLLRKHKFFAFLPPIAANTVIVPFILSFVYKFPGSLWWFAFTVFAGEAVSCGGFGAILFAAVNKNKALRKFLSGKEN